MNIKLDIPEEFFKGEERCGYYVSPEMKKVWAVELDLIAEFARVCEKYNLKWWADSGTLLGSVRHNGFIPWDDDVDVIMMRKDYERLCEIADKEFKPPYCLRTAWNDRRILPWGKLHNEDTTMLENTAVTMLKKGYNNLNFSQGVFIDIFICDDVPDDKKQFVKILKSAQSTYSKASHIFNWTVQYYPSDNIFKRPIKALLHYLFTMLNTKYMPYYEKAMQELSSYRNPNSKYLSRLCGLLWHPADFVISRLWERSLFENTIYFPFEILKIPVPSGYERILTLYYDDWREPVITHTHGKLYDTEHSYKYYTEEGHPLPEVK